MNYAAIIKTLIQEKILGRRNIVAVAVGGAFLENGSLSETEAIVLGAVAAVTIVGITVTDALGKSRDLDLAARGDTDLPTVD